ncbi:Sensor histidine kinase RcsC [Alphaproteobacteria bacterium SO-S41]|nr:Sensor histidine kinase RcsC [Alphaproteobacteria bacterium SO-S41]
MKRVDARARRVLVLAPNGRDGALACALLAEAGVEGEVCKDLPALVAELNVGAGAAIIAEEALRSANITGLAGWLQDQPPWSDFPIILLSSHGGGLERNPAAQRWSEVLGNVTVIERPFHPTTLTAAVASAARSRYRQYEARARADDLREGEERLRTAMKAANLGAWTLNLVTSKLEASPESKAHYGRGSDELFDYPTFKAAVHLDDWGKIEAAAQHTLATGQDYWVVYRAVWPDGSMHWIDARGQPMRSAHGNIFGLTGVTADISARKSAELEREKLVADLARERIALSDLNATLEERVVQRTNELMVEVAARERAQEQLRQAQKMESIGQLTGGVAHDFNNLLMAVMSALNLLRRRIPETPQTKQLIDGAIQAAERGASLTQRLLAFARQQDLKTSAVDLSKLIGGMGDLLDRSLGPRFVLTTTIAPGLPPAQVDANQLELAILNLAINARDAMADGGSIDISVREEAVSGHATLPSGAFLAIRVADNGTGMDEATLKKAIEPFFSTKAVGKGTGLGLSMVHGLAVQLGGGFTLESTPGAGTVATIYVPRATGVTVDVAVEEKTARDTPGARVLVVDDDVLVASLTTAMLEELGHTVTEVHSGAAAMELLEAGEPVDLMMTDYLMPGMTGMDLVQAARRLRPALTVLIATGFAEVSDGLPADIPRISKPYDLDALDAQLAALRVAS